jgi:hypothetical protein
MAVSPFEGHDADPYRATYPVYPRVWLHCGVKFPVSKLVNCHPQTKVDCTAQRFNDRANLALLEESEQVRNGFVRLPVLAVHTPPFMWVSVHRI